MQTFLVRSKIVVGDQVETHSAKLNAEDRDSAIYLAGVLDGMSHVVGLPQSTEDDYSAISSTNGVFITGVEEVNSETVLSNNEGNSNQ